MEGFFHITDATNQENMHAKESVFTALTAELWEVVVNNNETVGVSIIYNSWKVDKKTGKPLLEVDRMFVITEDQENEENEERKESWQKEWEKDKPLMSSASSSSATRPITKCPDLRDHRDIRKRNGDDR